jgi:hypothetical protein
MKSKKTDAEVKQTFPAAQIRAELKLAAQELIEDNHPDLAEQVVDAIGRVTDSMPEDDRARLAGDLRMVNVKFKERCRNRAMREVKRNYGKVPKTKSKKALTNAMVSVPREDLETLLNNFGAYSKDTRVENSYYRLRNVLQTVK